MIDTEDALALEGVMMVTHGIRETRGADSIRVFICVDGHRHVVSTQE
jgi:hypothetical protein